MSEVFDELRRTTLRAVCDTVVPSLPRNPDPHGLWARSASDLCVPEAAERSILQLPEASQDGLVGLLDALAAQGFTSLSQESREQTLRNIALVGGAAGSAGINGLIGLVLFLAYGGVDPATGTNPMWQAWGYPGPLTVPPNEPKPITPLRPSEGTLELATDVVVVGSGAGGGVIAGVLAQQGLDVVVLEAGGYRNEADFDMNEISAYETSYWRGGPQSSVDGNITVMAGATLGGGTTINWMNCLRTPTWVRDEWAAAGLTDVVTADFDRHLDAVSTHINVTGQCTDLNKLNRLMARGADALGWSSAIAQRNADPERYEPASGGFIGFGDQSGAKNSTMRARQIQAVQASGDRTTEVASIRVPTLVIHGDRDLIVHPSGGRATADAIRGARHVEIQGMGHHLADGVLDRLIELTDDLIRTTAEAPKDVTRGESA